MTSEGQLHRRREDAHLVGVLGCAYGESSLAEVDLTRDLLHQLRTAWIEYDAQRVTLERSLGENIDNSIAQATHGLTQPLFDYVKATSRRYGLVHPTQSDGRLSEDLTTGGPRPETEVLGPSDRDCVEFL